MTTAEYLSLGQVRERFAGLDDRTVATFAEVGMIRIQRVGTLVRYRVQDVEKLVLADAAARLDPTLLLPEQKDNYGLLQRISNAKGATLNQHATQYGLRRARGDNDTRFRKKLLACIAYGVRAF